MASDDEPDQADRRRMLIQAVPFAANILWKTHTALSPAKLASAAMNGYTNIEKDISSRLMELRAVFNDIPGVDLQYDRRGEISLSLPKAQLLGLMGNYLKSRYSASSQPAMFLPGHDGYDGTAFLTDRTVFVKLVKSELDLQLETEIERAKKLNPSDVWIFSQGQIRSEFEFDPVFLSENKILRGHLRVMPTSSIITEISGRKYRAFSRDFESTDDNLHFRLTRNIPDNERG